MRAFRPNIIAKTTLLWACTLSLTVAPSSIAAKVKDSVPWRTTFAAGEQRLTVHDLSGAEAYFRQALAAVKLQTPLATDDIIYCMQRLAEVLQLENIREEGSMPLYRQALKLAEHKYGKNDVRLVPLLNAIANVYAQDVNYRHARKYFERAHQLAHDPITLAEDDDSLGKVAFGLGEPISAEASYNAALTRLMAQPELPNADLLQQVIADYIDLYMHDDENARNVASKFQSELLKDKLATLQKTQATPQSNFAKAVSGRLLELSTEAAAAGTAGATTLPTIKPDRSLPDFAATQNINQQRVDFYERMIETDIKSLGPKHPSVARDLTGLAAVYIRDKNYAQAKLLLARALEIYSTVYGADALLSRKTAALMSLIAEDEKDAQRGIVGATGGSTFMTHLVPVPPQSGKLEVALGLNYLALLLIEHGKTEDAARVYAWALADTVLATGENSTLTAACLSDYAKVLRSRGEMQLAEEMETGSRRILRNLRTQEAVLSLP